MQIFKFILLILVFGSSSHVGLLVSKKYLNRTEELKQIKTVISTLETKIKFTYEPLPEIFEQISKTSAVNIARIFKTANKKMKTVSVKEAWEESIDTVNLSINQEDKNILKELGNMLGQTDVDGQVSQIEVTKSFIDMQIEKAEEERKKNEKLYKTLGITVGLAIVIVLI